jgi:mono/diheme cytochrome c family protein
MAATRTTAVNRARAALTCISAIGALVMLAPLASAQDKEKIEAGMEVYNNYCAPCHGDALVNTNGQAFDLRKLTANDRARFEKSVLNGKNQMPPWRGVIEPDQIDKLWAYIRDNAFQK